MKKRALGCLVYIGDYATQLCGDYTYSIKIIRIPIEQPV